MAPGPASGRAAGGRFLVRDTTVNRIRRNPDVALLLPQTKTRSRSDGYRTACRHLAGNDPVMRSLIAQVGPCTLVPRLPYFPVLCDSIVSQQLSTVAAATIYRRFSALFPRRTPTPAAVRLTPVPELRRVGLSAQKAGYLRDLAEGFLDGRIVTRALSRRSNEEIVAALMSVRGIGRWTAEMFLIFSLNRLNVLPVDDLGIRKAIRRWYEFKSLPAARTVRQVGKPWEPYETVACWYLWQSLRLT